MKDLTYNVAPLVRARKLKRMSRTELGAKIGRTENMIWKIESGESASEKTIFLMSEALEVPMDKILREPADAGRTTKRRRAS